MPIREKQGTMITSEKEQEKRWKEHFEEILNRPDPNTRTEISGKVLLYFLYQVRFSVK